MELRAKITGIKEQPIKSGPKEGEPMLRVDLDTGDTHSVFDKKLFDKIKSAMAKTSTFSMEEAKSGNFKPTIVGIANTSNGEVEVVSKPTNGSINKMSTTEVIVKQVNVKNKTILLAAAWSRVSQEVWSGEKEEDHQLSQDRATADVIRQYGFIKDSEGLE